MDRIKSFAVYRLAPLVYILKGAPMSGKTSFLDDVRNGVEFTPEYCYDNEDEVINSIYLGHLVAVTCHTQAEAQRLAVFLLRCVKRAQHPDYSPKYSNLDVPF